MMCIFRHPVLNAARWIAILLGSNICLASTFYVSTTGSHTPPFNTPGKASTNIQSAVNIATNTGDLVQIQGGTYHLTAPVTVSYAITVTGTEGPEGTIVDGSGVTHCFHLGDVACILSGLTITNGYNAGDGGGLVCDTTLPVITNCHIVGNASGSSGGGLQGGTLHRCVVKGNTAQNQGGGVYGTTVPARIHDSLIAFNAVLNDYGGGVEFCDLFNCTVVGNSAPDAGGADLSLLYNCIVYSNEANANPDVAYSILNASCIGSAGDSIEGSYIVADPLFVDFAAGDHHLQTNSPCINAGNNAYVFNTVDLDGNPRISGILVDMGAYELQTPSLDSDGDGMSDDEEWIAGTSPTNPASFFAITNWTDGASVIEWPAFSNREYRIFWTGSLDRGFEQQGPVILYPQNSYTGTASAAAGFYRVEVRLQ